MRSPPVSNKTGQAEEEGEESRRKKHAIYEHATEKITIHVHDFKAGAVSRANRVGERRQRQGTTLKR
jgi:hypothetical protein